MLTFVVLFIPALLWGFTAGQGNVTFSVTYNVTTLQGDGEEGCPSVVQEDAVRANITQDIRMLLQDNITPAVTGGYGACQCGGPGWTQIAYLDMTDTNQQCPAGFTFISTPMRVCGKGTSERGCSSVTFETTGVQYQKVCGRIIGYQFNSPDAFRHRHNCPSPCGIDDTYVDGVSITHGSLPRKHVWTYAAGLFELEFDQNQCPCSSVPGAQPPEFVGNDYYCESGLHTFPWENMLYADDVLWDGQMCDGYEGPCCSPPDLPWFCKELPEQTTDDLEVRVCSDDSAEDIPIELIELYVQ